MWCKFAWPLLNPIHVVEKDWLLMVVMIFLYHGYSLSLPTGLINLNERLAKLSSLLTCLPAQGCVTTASLSSLIAAGI